MTRRAHRALLAGVDEDVLVRPAPVGDLIDVRQRKARRRTRAASAPRFGVERRDMPSADTPALIRAAADGRLPVTRCSSLRSSISLTGAFAIFASRAQISPSAPSASLLPNPPPMYWQMTRTLDCGMARALARFVARGVDALRRHPGRQLVAVPLAHRAVRLETDVRDDVRRVGFVERDGRFFETRRDIAGFLRLSLPDVAGVKTGGAVARPAPDRR